MANSLEAAIRLKKKRKLASKGHLWALTNQKEAGHDGVRSTCKPLSTVEAGEPLLPAVQRLLSLLQLNLQRRNFPFGFSVKGGTDN